MLAAVGITILYFIPIIYVCYQAFLMVGNLAFNGEDEGWEDEIKTMLDWMIMMIERSDLGGFWVIINGLVHF